MRYRGRRLWPGDAPLMAFNSPLLMKFRTFGVEIPHKRATSGGVIFCFEMIIWMLPKKNLACCTIAATLRIVMQHARRVAPNVAVRTAPGSNHPERRFTFWRLISVSPMEPLFSLSLLFYSIRKINPVRL